MPSDGVLVGLILMALGLAGGGLWARVVLRRRISEMPDPTIAASDTARMAEQIRLSEQAATQSRLMAEQNLSQSKSQAEQLLSQARSQSEQMVRSAELQVKEELIRRREELARETDASKQGIREQERRLEKREDAVEQKHQEQVKKQRVIESATKKLSERKELIAAKEAQLTTALEQQDQKLHEIAGMTRDHAEKVILERVERELSESVARKILRHDEHLRQTVQAKAKELIVSAIQRYAAEFTAEATVSTVDIPSDDMKGRIIGREGRNIRTFEKLTGVDVIVDDTPGVVVVSSFDHVRREIARQSLTRLIQDGRIHPTRIEEVVNETSAAMDKTIMEIGQKAVVIADAGPVAEKLVQLLGRLQFRTSYSQNVLQHSLEVCHVAGMIAGEVGLDPKLARRCALLHDIGKAADHEMEGGHPAIGAELARRYGETSKEVLHAIAGHHDDITIDNIYTVLVAAADAISASRPGARRETLDKYVKRLQQLEELACGFPGVDQAFAIQAGRELRVIANAQRTSDHEAIKLCSDIARDIESRLDYPGEIKVTVVRELRFTDTAK